MGLLRAPGAVERARRRGGRHLTRTRRPRSPRGSGEQLRDELIAATERLLIDTGDASSVSIRAIADAVGVTPPSIYRHFADKDELIFEVCQLQFSRLDADLAAAERSASAPAERLRAMAHAYVNFGVRHPEQYRILLMSKEGVSRDDFESGRMPGVEAFSRLLRTVEECIAEGEFARRDPFLVASGLWALVHGITSLSIAMPEFPFVGRDVLIEHVVEVSRRGLAP